MRIKDLKCHGLPMWPPIWAHKNPELEEGGVLKSVEIMRRTSLIRIDAHYAGTIFSGLIISGEENQESLYRRLKEHLGKPLKEVGDLEITI